MKKDFDGWNEKKKHINNSTTAPFVHEGEIWWCSLGANVGYEEDGKNNGFERPVVIFRKFNTKIFLGFPITTQIKSGRYYFNYMYKDKIFAVILSQIRLLDTKRLKRKIRTLPQTDRDVLCTKFLQLLK